MAAIPTAGAVDPGLVTAYPTRLSGYHEDVDLTTPNSPSSDDKHEKTRSFDDNTVIEDGPQVAHLAGGGYIENKSKGVVEMESLKERVNLKFLIILYGSFALLAYVLSLNQATAATFLTEAVSRSFQQHALQATINTITAVFQAMSQPPIAKFADVFGRVNAYLGCVAFFVIGYIIVASSNGIVVYAVGNSIYILGITGLFLLQNIIISDISSLRNRFWWTIFPSIPGAINTWVSGDVAGSLLEGNGAKLNNWRWGFGMFCILVPVLATPITVALWIGTRPSRVTRAHIKAARQARGRTSFKAGFMSFFWQLDFIGLFLFVVGFGMFFVTVTLANSRTARWSDAHSIALLTVGGITIIAFGLYERFYAPHPLLPIKLLRNRTVIAVLLLALVHPMSGRIVNGYFYTFLLVAANYSRATATRLTAVSGLAGTVSAIFAALLTRYIRRLKPIVIFGFAIQTLAYGLMIRFRQSSNGIGEIIIVQILKGVGIGCISFPLQAIIQSASSHEHLGAITAGYLVVFYLSGGIGSSIGGAIWTNVVPNKINDYMGNDALARAAYQDPLGFIAKHAVGTEPRLAVARAQDEAQRTIVIVGTCVCALGLLIAIFLIDNIVLPDTQSLPENEDSDSETMNEGGRRDEKAAKNAAGVPAVPTL